jgi:hypothetical protein
VALRIANQIHDFYQRPAEHELHPRNFDSTRFTQFCG